MENIQEKANFLKNEFTAILTKLDADAPRKWGKMNVQQMIEHMSDYVRIANGKTPVHVVTEAEKIPRMQGFLTSEKPFPENTPNALMPETPPQVRHATKEEAIAELQQELGYFFEVHEKEAGRKTNNPFFGELSYEMQVQLLHKHGMHHLNQFGALG
jgi:hypothetical protein